MRRPHVVLIHRYFSPDTPPYATILREIAIGLAEAGMSVEVLTCQPSYNRAAVSSAPARERIADHVRVTRWRVLDDRSSSVRKIANLITFGARLAARILTMRRVDAMMAASTPPVFIAAITSWLAKIKKAPFVYHNQDIYPEVVEATGGMPAPLRRVLRRLDADTDRRASRAVVLSKDMADSLTARGVQPESVTVINNFDPWTLDQDGAEFAPHRAAETPIRMVYAGNLGRFQNLEALANAIRHLGSDPRYRLDFIGDGPLRPWLERYSTEHGLTQVQFLGYLSPKVLAEKLRHEYDVGVLSLHPGVIRCAYPSKTMSYLRHGLPVLALVEPDTELVKLLERHRAGWSAAPGNLGEVQLAINRITDAAADPTALPRMRRQAKAMYEQEFSRPGKLQQWVQLFAELTSVDQAGGRREHGQTRPQARPTHAPGSSDD